MKKKFIYLYTTIIIILLLYLLIPDLINLVQNESFKKFWNPDNTAIVISVIALGATIFFEVNSKRQATKDKEPQLCFDLMDYNGLLFLDVKNSGKTKANNIRIKIKNIYNNGNNKEIKEDFIFSNPFELNSDEHTQGFVAVNGEDIETCTFPYIDIEVIYDKTSFRKKVKYDRQVFYNPHNETNSLSDIERNIQCLNIEIDKLRNPILRLANYFDAHQLVPKDNADLILNRSLQNDLYDVIVKKKRIDNISREDTLKKRIR